MQNYKKIFYKSDFALTIQNGFDWGKPFRARLFTTASRHAKVVSFDGFTYKDCKLSEDGKLQVSFDHFTRNYGQGLGPLKIRFVIMEPNPVFKDGFLNRVLPVEEVQILDDEGGLVGVELSLQSDEKAPAIAVQLDNLQGDEGAPV